MTLTESHSGFDGAGKSGVAGPAHPGREMGVLATVSDGDVARIAWSCGKRGR